MQMPVASYNALCHHSLGNLHEASYVSALDIVDVSVSLFSVLHACVVYGRHDVVELLVHFFL